MLQRAVRASSSRAALNTIRSAARCKSLNRSQPSTIGFTSFGSRNFSLFSRSVSSEHTPTQGKLAALESNANASPEDTEQQIELFKALLDGGAEQGVIARWEGALRATPPQALAQSSEAFDIYLLALARTGLSKQIPEAVRERDAVLAGQPSFAASSTETSESTADAPTSIPTMTPLQAKLASLPGFRSRATPPSAGSAMAATSLAELGQQAKPVHVVLEESRGFSAARVAKTLGVNALYIFCFLTLASLILENTGLLKAGNQPTEFDPEKGGVVRFEDVLGCDEAKDLQEVVEFLRNPERFSNLGGKLPKGVLLTGPPGTGKTRLARAVAGEAEVPFFYASGSSFDQMYVGVGAARVRELFAAARKKAPAIIFIDEIDAIGSRRSAKDQHYMKQTLNQLLVELDGFQDAEGVIVIGATNFPQSLDNALTRPGRFDRHVTVPLPDMRGRTALLKHYMNEVEFDVEVDPTIIARGCPGMSGADLSNLVNQAAIRASREGSTHVKLNHFEWAKDRILMGAERRSHYVTPENKKMTAYHEAGHALTGLKTAGAMPLHKVTIMPRGRALGLTMSLPEDDVDSMTRKQMNASIDVALGGRAAEELIYGIDETTSGCSSDLERATDVATRMVRNYGFSPKVGLVAHSDDDLPYLSGAKKDEIESEIRRFVDEGWGRVKGLMQDNIGDLHKLAEALVEYETLDREEVKRVLRGEKLDRLDALGPKLTSQVDEPIPVQIIE
ncbi:hypothetical protein FFLO_03667 [Filobasidium floriforme]|uniref:AAA+ ATPase domain-containing protein n=1 Tax=Filobasidium floriforme TaxID=5210 RepID=A0A8K0JMB5_9TREE|nr:hypothetical protein FFLO_03667 [Filobasidium floriforme]